MEIGHLLAKKWNDAHQEAGSKPTAMGTKFRYSAAHSCSRQQAYRALGAEETEPFDVASSWVTGIGEIIHEKLQDAILEVYPDAQFEVASQVNEHLSGSCDGLLTHGGEKVLIEIKTRGQYPWQKETGIGQYKQTQPAGPSLAAVAQAGMNALGLEAEYVCMVSLAKEAVSVTKAAKMGITDPYERFAAEWWIPREEWEPLALREVERISLIAESLEEGVLPLPVVVDDNGSQLAIKYKSYWACDYCAFASTCAVDGNAAIPVSLSAYKMKEEA